MLDFPIQHVEKVTLRIVCGFCIVTVRILAPQAEVESPVQLTPFRHPVYGISTNLRRFEVAFAVLLARISKRPDYPLLEDIAPLVSLVNSH